MNQENSILFKESRWVAELRRANPELSQEEIKKIQTALQKSGLAVCPRPIYCKCEDFHPGTAPGWKGELGPVCMNCVQHCWRCGNPSTDCGYSNTGYPEDMENVCYGCASGDD
jgi:hypothetical protein